MEPTSKSSTDPFALLALRDEKRRATENQKSMTPALEKIRQELKSGKAVVPSRSINKRRWTMSLALFVGLMLTSIGGLKQAPTTLIVTGAALSLGLSALFSSGFMPRAGRTASRPLRRVLLLLTTIGTLVGLSLLAREFLDISEHLVTRLSVACFAHVLLTGALASGLSALMWRRTDPFSPHLTGALLGAFGGLLGVLSVGMTCPSTEGWHLLFGHGLSVSTLAALGAFFGPRILSP